MATETATISLPADFRFGPVDLITRSNLHVAQVPPSLGALAAFAGTWTGKGFNTIFRPDSTQTPTPMPGPITTTDPADNVLELNLTQESLAFSPSLGSVPNRGMVQGDIFLNGIPYLQSINDVTTPGKSVGIHVEPGLWMSVPSTTDPGEGPTLVRMASIPHGTTITAQGTSTTAIGAPTIPSVDITPFPIGNPAGRIPFQNQTAANQGTRRIPQDLTTFIANNTITQAILKDPNTVLRNAIQGLTITSTTTISIDTKPKTPLFGGGTDNIAFLLGDAAAAKPNADAVQLSATFWIETVEHTIHIPVFNPGERPLHLQPAAPAGHTGLLPTFIIEPPRPITAPITIKVHSTQIQYSQTVLLNFNTLSWPHVSVATLVPSSPQTVPPTAWT